MRKIQLALFAVGQNEEVRSGFINYRIVSKTN